jgi:hypothetical protein
MAAAQIVLFVKFGKPARRSFRNEIRPQRRGVIRQRAADNLLHFAFVEINARSEHEKKLEFNARTAKPEIIRQIPVRNNVLPVCERPPLLLMIRDRLWEKWRENKKSEWQSELFLSS